MRSTAALLLGLLTLTVGCSSDGTPELASEEAGATSGSGGSDSSSTDASGSDGGTGGGFSSVCSLEENLANLEERQENLSSPESYGPLPAECEADLDGNYTAPVRIERDYGDQPSIDAAFKDGVLLAIDESLCEPVTPGESPDYSPCRQEYVCGCCPWVLNNVTLDGWVLTPSSGNNCDTASRYSGDGYIIEPGATASSNGSVSAPPDADSPCDICLDSCRGLSSCCTGTGCLCEAECMPLPGTCSQNFCCNAWGCLCRSCPCDESWCP